MSVSSIGGSSSSSYQIDMNLFPEDIQRVILSHLPKEDLIATSLVSKKWKDLTIQAYRSKEYRLLRDFMQKLQFFSRGLQKTQERPILDDSLLSCKQFREVKDLLLTKKKDIIKQMLPLEIDQIEALEQNPEVLKVLPDFFEHIFIIAKERKKIEKAFDENQTRFSEVEDLIEKYGLRTTIEIYSGLPIKDRPYGPLDLKYVGFFHIFRDLLRIPATKRELVAIKKAICNGTLGECAKKLFPGVPDHLLNDYSLLPAHFKKELRNIPSVTDDYIQDLNKRVNSLVIWLYRELIDCCREGQRSSDEITFHYTKDIAFRLADAKDFDGAVKMANEIPEEISHIRDWCLKGIAHRKKLATYGKCKKFFYVAQSMLKYYAQVFVYLVFVFLMKLKSFFC